MCFASAHSGLLEVILVDCMGLRVLWSVGDVIWPILEPFAWGLGRPCDVLATRSGKEGAVTRYFEGCLERNAGSAWEGRLRMGAGGVYPAS